MADETTTRAAGVIRRTREQIQPSLLDCPVYLVQEKDPDDGTWRFARNAGAFFTHEEVVAWANAHEAKAGWWRSYAIPARGLLKVILKAHTSEPSDSSDATAEVPR